MTTRKNFGGGVTDASLLLPNTAGGVLNVVPNTLQGVKNSGNTAANVIKSMSSRIADAFTHKPFDYEKLQAYAAGDGFMKKRKTAFGNAWKGIKNTPRYVGNVTKQLLGGTLATVVYGTGMLVGAPIGAAATLVKNTTQSVAGGIVDPMNSILKVGQQGADDKGLAFTKIEKSNTVSYTDYAKRITDNRALKKAKRAEKRAAIAAINAKYDGKSLAPKQPEAKKEEAKPETPPPAPDTEKTDGAKKNKDIVLPVDTPVPVAKTDSDVVVLGPTDDSEAKSDTPKNTFSAKIDQISQQSDHLGALAGVFSANKKLLGIVHCDIQDTIDTSKTIHPSVDAYGMVSMSAINNSIVPSMKIKTSHKDNAEILLHELLHYYINPYLYGAKEHKKGNLKVNPPHYDIAMKLYDSLNSLYIEAKNKGFRVKNGISIEDSIEEFVATMTNAGSVAELKRLGLYDRLFYIIQDHVSSVPSHIVPCTPYMSTSLKLGGMTVPRIGIGTFELGGSDKNNVEKYLTSAIKNGYRHIDTAQGYGNLKQVGNAITTSGVLRKEFFITSKIRPKADTKTSSSVLAAIQNQVNETNLGYIDLMLVHARDPTLTKEDMTQVLLGFKEARKLGLIKNIGVSNFDLTNLKRASTIIPDIACNQIECHPYSIPTDIVNYCHNKDILVTAYSPFGSDSKGGKSKDDVKQAAQNIVNNPVIKEIAAHYPNKSLHQVVLRYLLQLGVVTIPASSNPENQKSNLDIFDFFISGPDMKKFETINKGNDGSIYTEYYKNKGILK